jgi:hypothetical protein
MKGAVEDWATESLLAARQAYQVPETGVEMPTSRRTCRLSASGFTEGACGWRGCSTRRFQSERTEGALRDTSLSYFFANQKNDASKRLYPRI